MYASGRAATNGPPQFACRVLLRLDFLRPRRRSSRVKTDVYYPSLSYPVHRAGFERKKEKEREKMFERFGISWAL